MFGRFNSTAARVTFTLLTMACFVILSGCGDLSRSPLVSDPAATIQEGSGQSSLSDSPSYIVLSPRALRAAKPGSKDQEKDQESVSDKFKVGKTGGELEIKLPGKADKEDLVCVKKVKFKVDKKSIEQTYDISMTVFTGSTLEDVMLAFTPSGIAFEPPATLEIYVEGAVDADLLKAYHITGDGEVTEVGMDIDKKRKEWKITIKVPGFSRYDLSGNDDYWNYGEGDDY